MEDNKGELKGSRELALHYMTTLVEVARESFLILDHDLRVVTANPTFYQNFKVKPEETENVLLYDLGNGQWNIPELKSLLEEILPEKKVVKDYEVKHIFETIGEKTILLNARQIDIDTVQMIVLALEDISVRKELETKLAAIAVEKEEIRVRLKTTAKELATYTTGLETKAVVGSPGESGETNAQNEAILASIGDGLAMVDIEGNIIYVNKSFEQMLGWKMQEVVGKSMVEVVPTEDINRTHVQFKEEILSKVLSGEKFIADLTNPFYFIRKDKSRLPVSIIVTPVFIGEKIVGAVETFRDITKEKEREESLANRVADLEKMNNLMVGRELKMIELKKEIEELKTKK